MGFFRDPTKQRWMTTREYSLCQVFLRSLQENYAKSIWPKELCTQQNVTIKRSHTLPAWYDVLCHLNIINLWGAQLDRMRVCSLWRICRDFFNKLFELNKLYIHTYTIHLRTVGTITCDRSLGSLLSLLSICMFTPCALKQTATDTQSTTRTHRALLLMVTHHLIS